jgi:hypothetical protein
MDRGVRNLLTPAAFLSAYLREATLIAARTGLDADLFLAQWAVETGWAGGWAGAPYNLGNIRDSPTSFALYPSVDTFITAECNVIAQDNMAQIREGVGKDLITQMQCLGASPWDAGHYLTNDPRYSSYGAGGKLIQYWEAMRVSQLDNIEALAKAAALALVSGNGTTTAVPIEGGVPDATGYAAARFDERMQYFLKPVLDAIAQIPGGGTVIDTTAILAAISDLKSHPAYNPQDQTMLDIVTRLENAARTGNPAA